MLIKVTNKCSMGCSHCMEDSVPSGEHMTLKTFRQALLFTEDLEGPAWERGCPPFILLSGGECTEHPDILECITEVERAGMVPLLITNGMWLSDKELRESILLPGRRIHVQVTNDLRFYPDAPVAPAFGDPRVTHVPQITSLIPLGRAAKRVPESPPKRTSPTSFNLRSLVRGTGDIRAALVAHRLRAASGLSGNCSPSISSNGDVVAGETRNCYKVGTVWSTAAEITDAFLQMGTCNRCGLEDGLPMAAKRAIGLTALYGPGEH